MPRSLVGTRSQSSAVLGLVLGACGCNFLGYGALLAGQAGSLGGCGAESAQESSDEGVNNYCAGERAGATWATVGGCALCLGGVYLLLYAACVKKKRPRVAQMDADELEDCLEELDVLRTAVSHAWERCATLEDELHVQSSRSKRESEQALRIKGLEAEIGSLREGVRELGGATVGGFFSSSSAKSAAGTRGLELPADKAGKGGLGGMVTNPLALAKMVGGGGGGRRGTGDLERQLAILTESKASLRRDLVTSNTKVEQLERHASLIAAYQKSAEELNGSLEITLKKAFPDGSPSQPRLHQELEKFKSSVYRDNQYDAQFVELVYEKFLVQKMMGLLDELQKQHALSSLELTRQERMYGELLNRIPKLIAASSGAAASGSGEGPGGGPAAHPDGKQNQQDKVRWLALLCAPPPRQSPAMARLLSRRRRT